MKRFNDLVAEAAANVNEMFPWDLEEFLKEHEDALIVDIREPYEYDTMHIANSINVPRGILESACEWDFEETEPELVKARQRPVVLVCRSGSRTVLAAHVMQQMGYENVISLKTGLRGWNEYELPLVDVEEKPVDIDDADHYFANKILPHQKRPKDE